MRAIDNFRRHINNLLAENKFSILAISKGTGIARNLLYGYFRDGKEIDISRAEKIARFVGVSLNDLLQSQAPKFSPPRAPTDTEKLLYILENFSLGELRLSAIRIVLTAKEEDLPLMNDILAQFGEMVRSDHIDTSTAG